MNAGTTSAHRLSLASLASLARPQATIVRGVSHPAEQPSIDSYAAIGDGRSVAVPEYALDPEAASGRFARG